MGKTSLITETPQSVCEFWFGSAQDDADVAKQQGKLWWSKNTQVDLEIRARFETTVQAALQGTLDGWAALPRGILALILLTDQFPRNMYRGTPAAFQGDATARAWCQRALALGADAKARPIERVFLYLPLEHSEAREDQAQSVQLFTQLFQQVPIDQLEIFRGYLTFALRHRRVIDRFGRFPHRNAILERPSTADEIAFLQEPGSSF